ncbi:hypothetical protein L9F63_012729, partial [Diploptera punctata]
EFFGRLYQIPLLRVYRKHDRSLQVAHLSYLRRTCPWQYTELPVMTNFAYIA